MGALAAMGLVLVARLASDGSRPAAVRAGAAASAGVVGAGVALSFSRGAIAAALGGLALLAALAPGARRAVLVTGGAALAAGAVAAALPAVRTFEGSRTTEALVLLAVLVAMGVAAAVTPLTGGARDEPARRLRPRTAVAALVVAVALTAAAAALERAPEAPTGATATRLASAESSRYGYWRVALGSFAAAPVVGQGAGSFSVEWLRERDVERVVRDAHSLELETAAEFGLVGLALLALFLGGIAAAAAGVLRRDPAVASGPVAALAVWAVHSALDWDWRCRRSPSRRSSWRPRCSPGTRTSGLAGRPRRGRGRSSSSARRRSLRHWRSSSGARTSCRPHTSPAFAALSPRTSTGSGGPSVRPSIGPPRSSSGPTCCCSRAAIARLPRSASGSSPASARTRGPGASWRSGRGAATPRDRARRSPSNGV